MFRHPFTFPLGIAVAMAAACLAAAGCRPASETPAAPSPSPAPAWTPAALLDTSGKFAVPAKGPYIANLDMHSVEIRWEVGPQPPETALVFGSAAIAVKISDGIATAQAG